MQVSDVMISSSTYCWLCTYPTATKGNWGHINIAELIVLIWCALLIIVAAFLAFKVLLHAISIQDHMTDSLFRHEM